MEGPLRLSHLPITSRFLIEFFKLNNVSKNIFEYMFSILCVVGKLGGHPQYVRALPDEVLQVLLPALVSDLGKPGLFTGESLV